MKTGIEGILTLKGCNVGITGGNDLLSAALKRAQAVSYVYRVPRRSVKATVFNFNPPPLSKLLVYNSSYTESIIYI
jgi:hypothetical protein